MEILDLLFFLAMLIFSPLGLFIGLIIWFFYAISKPKKASKGAVEAGSIEEYQQALVEKLQQFAGQEEYQNDRLSFLSVAEYISPGSTLAKPRPTDPLAHVEPESAPAVQSNLSSIQLAGLAKEPSDTVWNKDISKAFKSIDNINLLLFLGAFLIVISAAIFVGMNYGELSGFAKTAILAFLVLIFYISGIALTLTGQRFRPAGSAFTGIGLVLIPMIGLAAYRLILEGNYGEMVWLWTSLITLGVVIGTYALLRQRYLGFLIPLSSLSLILASISTGTQSPQYIAWGVALTSLIMLAAVRVKQVDELLQGSFLLSANVFLPLSFLMSFVLGGIGQRDIGVTLVLASIFYALMSRLAPKEDQMRAAWGGSILLLPVGAFLALKGYLAPVPLAGVVAGIGLLYALFVLFLSKMNATQGWREKYLGVAGGGILLVAPLIAGMGEGRTLLALLVLAGLVNYAVAYGRRHYENAFFAILASLSLPTVAVWVMDVSNGSQWVASGYLAVTGIGVAWRWATRSWLGDMKSTGQLGYLAPMAAALITALLAGPYTLLFVSLVLAAAAVWLGFFEDRPLSVGAAVALTYVSVLRLPEVLPGDYILGWMWVAIGLIFYFLSQLLHEDRKIAVRLGGVAGLYLGFFASLENITTIVPGSLLGLAGLLTLFEGYNRNVSAIKYFAAAVITLSLNLIFLGSDISETQLYVLPWAAYFAWLAYQLSKERSKNRDGAIIASLFFLTIPLAVQSLGSNGHLYGLLLIFESIALVFLGIALRIALIRMWGSAALMIEVLYQFRDVFAAIPKYAISAILGLGLIAAAMWLLSRRRLED